MKTLRIREPLAWRPDARSLYHFGDYRIPADMSEELAAQAVADGVGELVEDKRAAPPPETKGGKRR